MYHLRYKKTALKGLRKLPSERRQQMTRALQAIAADPDRGDLDVMRLINRPGYRLRLGRWRAIYRIERTECEVLVLDVGPRGEIHQ